MPRPKQDREPAPFGVTVDEYLARKPEIACRIVDGAARLFRHKGFAEVRMQDIGDAVGLSKAGLYHHCQSKDLLLATIVRLCGDLLDAQLQSVVDADGGAGAGRLERFIVSRMETISRHQDFFTVFWQERPQVQRADFSNVAERAERYRAAVRGLVRQAKASGAVDPSVDEHLVMLAMDGMTGWAYLWFRPDGSRSPEEIGATFFRFLQDGIGRR